MILLVSEMDASVLVAESIYEYLYLDLINS